MATGEIRVKRVYALPAHEDGTRILVDRLWPRGIARETARIDLWLKDVSPSDALRKEFHGHPDRWDEFVAAYAGELAREPAATAVTQLREFQRKASVTLLFAAKHEARNNAVALKNWLDAR